MSVDRTLDENTMHDAIDAGASVPGLIADRFVVGKHGAAIDLATGSRVELRISIGGGGTDAARWAARCGFFAALHHGHVARLLDYGPLGDTHRFEAWACDGPWRGAREAGTRACAHSAQFLDANGLTASGIGAGCLRACGPRPVILPDAAAGYRAAVCLPSADVAREALGLRTITRAALAAFGDVLEVHGHRRPIALALSGPRGSGLRTAVSDLARMARRRGYVPLSSRLVQSPLAIPAHGRSLFLLADSGEGEGWASLLHVLTRCSRPHVLLFTGIEPAGVRTLQLTMVSDAALAASVLPLDLPSGLQTLVRRLAIRARGSPVRFATLLWERPLMCHDDDRPSIPRAAEPAVSYGEPAADVVRANVRAPWTSWPAPAELMAIRRRATAAIASLHRGRHAPADRTLRQVIAAFTRRGAAHDAAQASLALAASLRRRGRIVDAGVVLADAKATAVDAGDAQILSQLAVVSGHLAVDDARLDDAECLLSGAMAAAEGLKQWSAERAARLALARCLFWRGQFEKGWQLLATVDASAFDDHESVKLALERSRLAVGRGDLQSGVSAASAALLRAERSDDSALVAEAARGAAFTQLSVGDLASASALIARSVAAARRAHDPLLALRARLLGAESERRRGRRGPAVTLVGRIRRMSQFPLARVLRARVDLLAALLTGAVEAAVVAEHVRSTGLGGLALFAPLASKSADLAIVHDIVGILQCCQAADEDAGVLAALAARLRSALDAAAVGFFLEDQEGSVPVAVDGGRLDAEIACRVLRVDQPIVPRAIEGRVESGAPVRYGGKRVGALVARWTISATVAEREAMALLTTTATAAAPALAAAQARRRAPVVSAASHLLGTSDAMAAIRSAVERAAPAPFAVLIQGESGSGKELVARALHRQGPRRDRPFCTLNCAALPDDLVESELFGHARGAFTGAVADRPGIFEEAHTGTLFLDEVGELSLRAQAKALRTIQDGELRRVGENVGRRIDLRLVCATNRDLRHEVAEGRFRLDLLYRLDVIRITVPPLRERRDDIPLLAEHFWREATARLGSRAALSAAVLGCLARYDWPGNVRELQNVLAALAVRCSRRGVVGPSALPPPFDQTRADMSWRLDDARRTFETRFIRAALARSGGHRGRAAEEMGVTRQGLSKLMARLGIPADPDDADSSPRDQPAGPTDTNS